MDCLERCFKRKVDVSPSILEEEGSTPTISVSELSISAEIQYVENVTMVANPLASAVNKV
jgi:hypothetical protein|tara:strand:- start:582 stop:761 length:180 start_codon:yes stop_codon:yes gene_type:complete